MASIIALSDHGDQIYSDQFAESSNSYGAYIDIAALVMSVINEALKAKNKAKLFTLF